MKKSQREVIELAEDLGITTDELLDEMEIGSPIKGFTVAITFSRLEDMKEFGRALSHVGVGIYKSDALDPEWKNNASKNKFVLRAVHSNSKPEEWRIA